MFEGSGVLISEDIGSLSVTSFSPSWSLEIRKYDIMPWIVGLFTVFLFLISFPIASSMKLKLALVDWFFWKNPVIDLLSGRVLLFLISTVAFVIWPEKYQHYLRMSLKIHLGDNNDTIKRKYLQNSNKLITLIVRCLRGVNKIFSFRVTPAVFLNRTFPVLTQIFHV